MENRKDLILKKRLIDIDNHDLAMCGFPDSAGSFLVAAIEDRLKLNWNEVKNEMTLKEFSDLYNLFKQNKING
jgi:hypothetical protein